MGKHFFETSITARFDQPWRHIETDMLPDRDECGDDTKRIDNRDDLEDCPRSGRTRIRKRIVRVGDLIVPPSS